MHTTYSVVDSVNYRMNWNRKVYSTIAVGAVMLAACLVYWYYRRKNRGAGSRLLHERSGEMQEGRIEPEMQFKCGLRKTKCRKLNLHGFTPHKVSSRETETRRALSASEPRSYERIPSISESSRVPRSRSEGAAPHLTSQLSPSQEQKHGTENRKKSSYETCAICPDVQQKDSESKGGKSETAKQGECDIWFTVNELLESLVEIVATVIAIVDTIEVCAILARRTPKERKAAVIILGESDDGVRIRRLTTIDEDEELEVNVENAGDSLPEGKELLVFTEQSDEERLKARKAELSMTDAYEDESDEEDLPESTIYELASKVVFREEHREPLGDSVQEIASHSFFSPICCYLHAWYSLETSNVKTYGDAFAQLKLIKMGFKPLSVLKDIVPTDLLVAQTSYFMSRQYNLDSKERRRLIMEGYTAASSAYRTNKNFPALRWLAIISIEKTRYLECRSKYKLFFNINIMLQRAFKIVPNDYFITYARGRLLYEYANYTINEMNGTLINQSKHLRTAISCIEKACRKISPGVFIESLYYLACCYVFQGEKEKAKKLLPLTERVCLFDQVEAEYLYKMRKMLE